MPASHKASDFETAAEGDDDPSSGMEEEEEEDAEVIAAELADRRRDPPARGGAAQPSSEDESADEQQFAASDKDGEELPAEQELPKGSKNNFTTVSSGGGTVQMMPSANAVSESSEEGDSDSGDDEEVSEKRGRADEGKAGRVVERSDRSGMTTSRSPPEEGTKPPVSEGGEREVEESESSDGNDTDDDDDEDSDAVNGDRREPSAAAPRASSAVDSENSDAEMQGVYDNEEDDGGEEEMDMAELGTAEDAGDQLEQELQEEADKKLREGEIERDLLAYCNDLLLANTEGGTIRVVVSNESFRILQDIITTLRLQAAPDGDGIRDRTAEMLLLNPKYRIVKRTLLPLWEVCGRNENFDFLEKMLFVWFKASD